MPMVLERATHISGSLSPSVYLTDEPQFHQGVQGAVYRDQANAGVSSMHLRVYLGGGEMSGAIGNNL